MFTKLISIIVSNLVLPALVFSQITPPIEVLLSDRDYYSENYLSTKASGRGYTGVAADNDLTGILLNPASLKQQTKFQFYGAYIYKSDMQWLKRVVTNLYLKQLHPTMFAGVSYKLNENLTAGISYASNQSYRFDLGLVPITTVNNPEGNGEFFDAYYDISTSSLSVPVVYAIEDVFRAGISLNYFFYSVRKNAGSFTGKEKFQKFVVNGGLIYKPVKNFSIGIAFTPESEKIVEEEVTGPDTTYTHVYSQPNIFPLKISGGLSYRFTNFPLMILGDVNFKNSSKEENLKDRINFNFGFEYKIIENLDLRTGVFTLKDNREEGPQYVDPVGEYSQVFGTLGGTYVWGKFNFNVSVMDSHLFSNGLVKQTIINGGIGYNF